MDGASSGQRGRRFWGDRFDKLVDPFGHEWAMAAHKEDLSPEEIWKRASAAMASMASSGA